MNGQDHPSHSVHVFHVGKMRIKLCRGWITKARENYSLSMQVLFIANNFCFTEDGEVIVGLLDFVIFHCVLSSNVIDFLSLLFFAFFFTLTI